MSSTLKSKGRLAALAAAVALVGTVGLATPAHAASGTHGCGANYGWLTANIEGSGNSKPPGSNKTYVHSSTGSYTNVAAYSNGTPKTGGGAWLTYGTIWSGGSPFCRAWG